MNWRNNADTTNEKETESVDAGKQRISERSRSLKKRPRMTKMMMMMMMTIKTTMTARTLQEETTARKIPATDPAKKNVRQLVMRINLLTMYFFFSPQLIQDLS